MRLRGWRLALILVALASVALSLINASWLAPSPPGHLVLIATGGVGQRLVSDGDCGMVRYTAEEGNPYIENTLPSLYKALRLGAQAVAIPVARTRDGAAVAIEDAALDCRTNGHGGPPDHSLAEIKALDAGYRYTPDNGRSFPLRGRGIGAVPTVEEVLGYIPTAGITFVLGDDPADADALIAAFRRAAVPFDERYSTLAPPKTAARLRKIEPKAWVYSPDSGSGCLADYIRIGWSGFVPKSCRNTTVVLPIGDRWMLWGWPYRFLDRMSKAGTKVVIVKFHRGEFVFGLDEPEQYDKVPRDFHGSLWVEDIWTMGPSLRR